MERKQRDRLILTALVVFLLFVISSRINPTPAAKETSADAGLYGGAALYSPPTPTVEPTPTPEPTRDPELPEIDIYDWKYKLINGVHVVSSSFVPNVTEIRDGQYFDERASEELESMLSAAEQAGYSVYVKTGYRPYATQATLFYGRASQIAYDGTVSYEEAEQLARKEVAYPGTSDHQTALAVDVVDSADTKLNVEDTESLPLLKWLREHCSEYGFIQRYPKNRQNELGWYEPWHFRYVGVEAAQYIMSHNISLEEFTALY